MVAARMTNWAGWACWGWAALASVGIALFSYRYLSMEPFAPAPNVVANPLADPWLPIHAAAAATALLIGAVQLVPALRRRVPRLHRWIGRLYVAGCVIGGLSGFVLALGSTAGPVATAGFGTLAVFWVYATLNAWRLATARRFAEHRRWMIRSWAMTFAAVTLRLYLPMIPLTGLPFLEGYALISWLCWTINLAVAELYLRYRP